MAAKTNYLEDALLNHVLRGVPFTPPSTLYVALFTADPGESGSLTNEIAGASYARQAVTFGSPSGNAVANTGSVVFPQAVESWGGVTHVAIMDAATGGNALYYGALGTPKTVGVGDQVSFATGALSISED